VYFFQNQGSQNNSAHKSFYSKLSCKIAVIQKYKQILCSLQFWVSYPVSETPSLANDIYQIFIRKKAIQVNIYYLFWKI